MQFDFAALLVFLTVLTGGVWAIDAIFFKQRRLAVAGAGEAGEPTGADKAGTRVKDPVLVEYARSFFPVILAVLVIRSFLVEPFRIPSSSMMPTLIDGDLILVNKFSYGIRLPVLNTKILDLGGPARGDVVVFRYPKDTSEDYIKRVVGLPGERIEYRGDKVVMIDGKPVTQEREGPYTGPHGGGEARGHEVRQEYLADEPHPILINPNRRGLVTAKAEYRSVVVPEGHYFVMGDNRDNSEDSRYWGFVPEENLKGRAFLIWMHLGFDNLDRIGTIID